MDRGRRLTAIAFALALAGGLLPQIVSASQSGGRQTLEGTVEVLHSDDFHRGVSHTEYRLRSGNDVVELSFADEPTGLESGTALRASGERRGERMRVESYEVAEAPGGNNKGQGGGNKGGQKGDSGGDPDIVSGERATLVIMFNFDNDTSEPATPDEMRSWVFGDSPPSAATYFHEVSFGTTQIVGLKDPTGGDVAGWFAVKSDNTSCDIFTWTRDAGRQAKKAGFNPSDYHHVIHFFPRTEACSFSGAASLGGSNSWLNGATDVGIIVHELGHNLGLHHANRWECQSDDIRTSTGDSCGTIEYGDPFDVMGTAAPHPDRPDSACFHFCHFNAFNKARLGWIEMECMPSASSSGIYTLTPIETDSCSAETADGGVQGLQIPRGDGTYLYVEFRQPHGYDDFFSTHDVAGGTLGRRDPNHPVANGATIRIGGSLGSVGKTHLIDSTPTTDDYADAPLLEGVVFVDPVGGIRIESGTAGDTLTVQVTLGYADAAPVVDPGEPQDFLLVHHQTGASATDADENLLAYRWSFVSCPSECPELQNASGAISGDSADIPGPTYSTSEAGTYELALTVWDTAGRATTETVEARALG